MKKVSKILAVFVAVLMFSSVLAGCKSTKNTTSTTGVANITYALWGGDTEAATTQKVLDKFNASQTHIHVTAIPIDHDTYVEKLNTMATAGTLPDTAIMSEAAVIQWATQGKLADVSTMYAGSAAPLPQLAFKYNGKTVAYSAANEVLLMYYNKKMFDAAGVAYPPTTADKAWTWDQFIAAAKKLTIDKNGKTADAAGFDTSTIKQYGAMVENLTWQLEEWCLSNGGGFVNSAGTALSIGDSASTDAIQKVADLYLVNHVAPLSTGLTDDGVPRSIVAGTCAMTTNGAWNIGTCLPDATKAGLSYGVAVLPYMQNKVTLCTGGPNVVFSTTKHSKEAMTFLKWYDSADNNWDLISQGIWMPITSDYYTDSTLTNKWLNNPNFPTFADSKSVLVDYAQKNTKQACWYYSNNISDFETLLTSVLGNVWTGKVTAQKAITDNMTALNAAFKGNS